MLGNKLATNYYWYNDEYMYFSFNGNHSSKYHLFIQNTKDLTIENTVGAASEYSNAMMQEGTYYLGTSRKQKTFKRKCAAELEDMLDYKRMMKWLTPGTTGELVFDSDKYWGWTVVLDTVGDATFVKRGKYIVVEFDITFKTIGTYLAHSVYPASFYTSDDEFAVYLEMIGTNNYGIPTVLSDISDNGSDVYALYVIQGISNTKQSYCLSFDFEYENLPTNELIMQMLNDSHEGSIFSAKLNLGLSNSKMLRLEYVGDTSTLYINGQIAEEDASCIYTNQHAGIINLSSTEPFELFTVADNDETGEKGVELDVDTATVTLRLDQESFDLLSSNNCHYICLTCRSNEYTPYGTAPFSIGNLGDYKTDTLSFLAYNLHYLEANIQYIGNYTLDANNNTVTMSFATLQEMFKNSMPLITTNLCHIYCGHSKQVGVIISQPEAGQTNMAAANITVYSYNNL